MKPTPLGKIQAKKNQQWKEGKTVEIEVGAKKKNKNLNDYKEEKIICGHSKQN